jgi:hypothetical protein
MEPSASSSPSPSAPPPNATPPPSAAGLLQAWENGQGWPPISQALCLLAVACPGEPLQALAALPIGCRDRRLMDLRRRLFGPCLDSLATCPQCGERLELSFDLAAVQAPQTEGTSLGEPDRPGAWDLETEGYWLRFRLPNSLDLLAAQQAGGRLALLERCLLEARYGDRPQAAADLPEQVQTVLAGRMAELDPQAEVRFPVDCPVCGHRWMAVFDIASFLWQELNTWALRTLDEVSVLARAYAWREADILALSPWRRRYYIDRIAG